MTSAGLSTGDLATLDFTTASLEATIKSRDAEIERLRALLLNALPHVEGEGDDTLATIIHQELSQRREG